MNITGRLTRDAEVRNLPNEKKVVNFSIATNDNYRNKQGERIEQTSYFDCSYWISPNVAKILTKGALVELTGRASTRAWSANDGELRASLNFHTATIKLHGGGKKTDNILDISNQEKRKVTEQETVDDLPF